MDKEELIETVNDMIDNGSAMVDVLEFIEDNTDLDPVEIAWEVLSEKKNK